jgi:hypothetical protein
VKRRPSGESRLKGLMIEEANHAPMNTAAHRFRIGQAELPPVDQTGSRVVVAQPSAYRTI